MIRGTLKCSGIAIAELSVNRLGPTLKMEAKAAFVNPETGTTHGWTNGNQWTPETIQKLDELISLMEADMGRTHFEGSVVYDPVAGIGKPGLAAGLGEYVAGRDGDQA